MRPLGPPIPPERIRLAASLLIFLASAPAARGQSESSCVECHPAADRAEEGGPHARAGVGCADCHGGDPAEKTREAAKAEGTGFLGMLEGEELVTACGNCHADIATMNPYGIATDQLARYRTSAHGEALFAEGDRNVATCTSCHGVHGILPPTSSESPVHPTHVASTCGECHADAELMRPYGIDEGILEDWRQSVHAERLLEEGDLSAPTCATCHGSHGAVPPGFRTVSAVCGQCHVREKELFAVSPHGPLAEAGELPGCETCHGNHRVQGASVELLERMCSLCHSGEEEPLQRRDRIVEHLKATSRRIDAARETLETAAAQGLVTEDARLRLTEAETALERARVVQHALDPSQVQEATAAADRNLEQLTTQIEREREEKRLKRLSIVPVVAFLALMSLGFWVRQRRVHRDTGGPFR